MDNQPPFYIINLASSTKRWNTISKQINVSDLKNWHRLDAFVGKELESKPEKDYVEPRVLSDAKKSYRKHHYDHNLGSIGCYISHMRAWEKGLELGSETDYIIVCEDDIEVPNDIAKRMKQILDNAPRDWQVLVMGHYTLQDKHSYYVEVNQNFYIVPTVWTCMNLYAVKKSACKYLLRNAVPIRKQLDWFVSDHSSKIKIYIALEPAVTLSKAMHGVSDIKHTAVKP
jgi:GR25 family glycosyltransferase involved in LPS biosynthesis